MKWCTTNFKSKHRAANNKRAGVDLKDVKVTPRLTTGYNPDELAVATQRMSENEP